jgi:hypothetical protein
MGILSWLFPSEADRLRKARALMARGRFEDARRGLVHCTTPEAEALYEECSAAVDKADVAANKTRARDAGFRGWKVEVTMKDAQTRTRLEGLIARELERAGIDLNDFEVDEAKVKAALARAEQKARNKGMNSPGTMKVVPVMAGPQSRQER